VLDPLCHSRAPRSGYQGGEMVGAQQSPGVRPALLGLLHAEAVTQRQTKEEKKHDADDGLHGSNDHERTR
jgi:hypothetical protein